MVLHGQQILNHSCFPCSRSSFRVNFNWNLEESFFSQIFFLTYQISRSIKWSFDYFFKTLLGFYSTQHLFSRTGWTFVNFFLVAICQPKSRRVQTFIWRRPKLLVHTTVIYVWVLSTEYIMKWAQFTVAQIFFWAVLLIVTVIDWTTVNLR